MTLSDFWNFLKNISPAFSLIAIFVAVQSFRFNSNKNLLDLRISLLKSYHRARVASRRADVELSSQTNLLNRIKHWEGSNPFYSKKPEFQDQLGLVAQIGG
ncbi:hypothetical protein [Poseidonocella sp. HB161398]|uniref:hypothetical protein n=1 Tax=Poseidonocella sp. HB161398 TaxID=2320855 RepID=UPI001109AF09|nr:hypothetical protein [Poseidonocella sp. HB161398]